MGCPELGQHDQKPKQIGHFVLHDHTVEHGGLRTVFRDAPRDLRIALEDIVVCTCLIRFCLVPFCWSVLSCSPSFLPFEPCLRLRITTGRARSFGRVCTFSPMKLGALHSVFCDGCKDDLYTGLQIFLNANTVWPRPWGVFGTMTTATFLPTEDGRFRSFALWPYAQVHLRGR